MPPVGFEPTISAVRAAADRAATGTGEPQYWFLYLVTPSSLYRLYLYFFHIYSPVLVKVCIADLHIMLLGFCGFRKKLAQCDVVFLRIGVHDGDFICVPCNCTVF